MRIINKHIVHCSDSLVGDAAEIRRWHIARGWADVGYHFIIKRDGEVEVGRTLDQIGAHCEGQNATSVGTCLIGKTNFTLMQFASLRRIHSMLQAMFVEIEVYGHRDFNPHKTCPNFDVLTVLKGK